MSIGRLQLPAFLQLTQAELRAKYEDLEWASRTRAAEGDRASSDKPSPYSLLARPSIVERNRYGNIQPYAENRIKLKVGEGQEDYINASPIKLLSTKTGQERKWIATQGPRHPTAPHLWRMILDETGPPEQPATVIMLTQTHEYGREKCFQYYPLDMSDPTMSIAEPDELWSAKVALLSVEQMEALKSERRTMRLTVLDTNGSMKRADPPGPGQAQGQSQEPEKLIYHYLYSAWPDFGVPEGDNRHALVALVQASRGHSTNNTQDGADDSPRIVHCSAGVGRSGTFIALDHLLSELEDGALDRVEPRDRDVIAEAVDTMRMQRTMMVQGPAQFQFLYDVLREQWLARHGQSDD